MKSKVWIFLAGSLLLAESGSAQTLFFDFDGYEPGPLIKQPDWRADHPELAKTAFFVMDGLGRTQKSGDKGLGIVSAGSLVNTSRTDGVPRKPGETYTAEFDFMAGLTPGTLDNPQNGLMLLLGDREVKPAERWNIVFEIDPQGNWEIKGNLGQWVSYAKLPSEAIVKRPKTGKMAVSKWHHFKLEIQKLETEHSFKSSLKITASDGEELVNWFGREVTVPADISFWNEEEIYFAIPGRDSIKGMFVIDNLTVSSEKK